MYASVRWSDNGLARAACGQNFAPVRSASDVVVSQADCLADVVFATVLAVETYTEELCCDILLNALPGEELRDNPRVARTTERVVAKTSALDRA